MSSTSPLDDNKRYQQNAAIFCCPLFILTKGVMNSGYIKKY